MMIQIISLPKGPLPNRLKKLWVWEILDVLDKKEVPVNKLGEYFFPVNRHIAINQLRKKNPKGAQPIDEYFDKKHLVLLFSKKSCRVLSKQEELIVKQAERSLFFANLSSKVLAVAKK